jgi:dienelactone hydrolase
MALSDFGSFEFPYEGKAWKVYTRGTGPGVLVMSEIPGITPQVVSFAERVVGHGFTVWMPHLFGEDGRPGSSGYILKSIAQACIRAEFAAFAAHRSSPICDMLRAMCRALKAEAGGKGVGAVGMCFTGNFALALMVDDSVLAPVLSQPSLPGFTPTRARKAALHVSPEELAVSKKRVANGAKIVALRFTNDPAVPGERFETLRREFGSGCETIEIDSSPENPYGIPKNAHSVLTVHLVDEPGHPTRAALDRVLSFFSERLR